MIMAGGAGTRFWPASRRGTPKQLLRMVGGRTMLQSTFDRLEGLCDPARVLVVTNRSLVEQVRGQLPELAAGAVLGEPVKRDTAPCIALAAAIIARGDPDAILAVMPSDHVIGPQEVFVDALRVAAGMVADDRRAIVTFGIPPVYPAEVFGYIERDSGRPVTASLPAWNVRRFREKPDAATAAAFLREGGFYWNSGIFVWHVQTILEAMRGFEPEIMQHIEPIAAAHGTASFEAVFAEEFGKIRGKSIDYAVMERYSPVRVIEAPFSWDDLGSWLSLARLNGCDAEGNTIDAKHLGIRTGNTIVRSHDDHLIVTLGVSDLIVVRTPDATLIASRGDEAAVKQVVEALELRGWQEYL